MLYPQSSDTRQLYGIGKEADENKPKEDGKSKINPTSISKRMRPSPIAPAAFKLSFPVSPPRMCIPAMTNPTSVDHLVKNQL